MHAYVLPGCEVMLRDQRLPLRPVVVVNGPLELLARERHAQRLQQAWIAAHFGLFLRPDDEGALVRAETAGRIKARHALRAHERHQQVAELPAAVHLQRQLEALRARLLEKSQQPAQVALLLLGKSREAGKGQEI